MYWLLHRGWQGMVGEYLNGQPLICGGYTSNTGRYYNDCFDYNFENNEWRQHGQNLTTKRAWSSAVMLNSSHWWITGIKRIVLY